MWTSVITIEIAKDNLKWRRRCRESKLTLSVWSASGGQSSPFGMRGQPMIQYVLYCIVLCTIQCEANQRAPTRHYDPSGRPLHCPCTTMMACSATFLSCHLNRTVCSTMSMNLLSDLVILCNDAICWRLQFWEAYMLLECFQVAGCLIKPECRELKAIL